MCHSFTSVVPRGHICIKFETGDLYKYLLRNFKFDQNQAKILGPLHEDICFTVASIT
jgi:hypothetical protein